MEHPGNNEYPLLLDLETLKTDFLPLMREWRDTYIDELPDHLLEPGEPGYHKYKCRTNWFNVFEKTLRLAVPHMTDPLLAEVMDYIENKFTRLDWKKWRTKDEIDEANSLLHKVTGWLERQ